MKKLSNREKNFVNKYIHNGFNGAKAARAAKYSIKADKEIATNLLTKTHIKEAILKHFEKEGDVTQKVLAECVKIATSDITDFVEIDELTGTIKIKPLKDIPNGMTSVIKKIKEKRVIKENADGTSSTVYDNIEYELWNKEKIIGDLLRVSKLINDRTILESKPEILNETIDKFCDTIRERDLKDVPKS